jgi:tetratricopeptide (TPR) repeat protein
VERNPQLAAAGTAHCKSTIEVELKSGTEAVVHRGRGATCAWLLLALSIFASNVGSVFGQCTNNASTLDREVSPADAEIQRRFDEKNWNEVVRLATPLSTRSADAEFAYGMAMAHLQRWEDARTALLAGNSVCPRQQRFAVELAGVSFQLNQYPEASRWLRLALRLNSRDEYANNFAGTVYLLMGNINAALKYWNRVQKPEVDSIQFDQQLRLQRLILDRAFAFSPAAVLHERDYETTQARLGALGIYASYNIVLRARSDEKFDVDFHATERNGPGSGWLQALVSTFSGAAYETVYPAWYNMGGSATNVEGLLRWDSQKRRAWAEMSAPLHGRPEWRGAVQLDARDENWAIRNSFTGSTNVLGSFDLERQASTAFIWGISSGRLQWSAGAELSNRTFHNIVQGTTLTPALLSSGFGLKALGSIQGTVLNVPERRFAIVASGSSQLARMWPTQPHAVGAPGIFGKLEGAATARWFPQAEGDRYEAQQTVRAGKIFSYAPIDELYLVGMERDTDLWLRGHVGTHDGMKGNSPLANSFFLSNSDFFRRIYGNGLISIKAGPLLDIARANAPASGLATGEWFFDTGVQAKLTVLGTSVVLTWGHDLRSGNNAFYGAAAPR